MPDMQPPEMSALLRSMGSVAKSANVLNKKKKLNIIIQTHSLQEKIINMFGIWRRISTFVCGHHPLLCYFSIKFQK